MSARLRSLSHDPRALGAVLTVLLVLVLVAMGRVQATKREAHDVSRRVDAVRMENANLVHRLQEQRERRKLQRDEGRGRGPGGIRSDWEVHLFDGPTEARSALDLAMAVDGSGFGRFKYEGEFARVVGTFPPRTEDGAGDGDPEAEARTLPVRERIDFVEWPIEFYVESSYPALLELTQWLTSSRPCFALRELEFEVLRDGHGHPVDRISLRGALSTFWLMEEG